MILEFRGNEIIVEEKLKKINDLGFKFRKTKDETEKEKIEKELKSIINELKHEAIKKFSSESDIKKFLDNVVNFNNYSFNNQLLIWLQNPNAQYVASKTTFNKMGYRVTKDDYDGIKVYMPQFYSIVKITDVDGNISYKPYFVLTSEEKKIYKDKNDDRIVFYKQKLSGFSLGNVFSVSDTNMPLDAIEKELNPILEYRDASEIKNCFIKTIYNDNFKVRYTDLENNTKGYCDFKNNEIVIKKGINDSMQLKVLIHEYAHSLAHKHLKSNMQDYKEHREKYETEAEAIAYTVAKYLGMDTSAYSLNYLYSWSKNKDFQEIDDSFSTIINYSKRIIKNFEKFYNQEFGLYADEYRSMTV